MAEKSIPKRSEVPVEHTWDLRDMYPDDKAWRAEYEALLQMPARIESFRGRLGESAETVLRCFETINNLSERAEKVYTYAFLLSSGDGGDAVAQRYTGLAMNMIVNLETACAFVEPELLALDPQHLEQMKEKPEFSTYRFRLENMIRSREHTLSEKEENLLARMSDLSDTPSSVYDMLTDVDMVHGTIRDEEGKEVALSGGTFGVARASGDRRVRQEAFETWFGDYKKYNNTLAKLYSGSVKQDWFYVSVRGHASSLEGALFSGNVPIMPSLGPG